MPGALSSVQVPRSSPPPPIPISTWFNLARPTATAICLDLQTHLRWCSNNSNMIGFCSEEKSRWYDRLQATYRDQVHLLANRRSHLPSLNSDAAQIFPIPTLLNYWCPNISSLLPQIWSGQRCDQDKIRSKPNRSHPCITFGNWDDMRSNWPTSGLGSKNIFMLLQKMTFEKV